MRNIYDLTYDQLCDLFQSVGISSFYTDKLWRGLYVDLAERFDAIADLKPAQRAYLEENAVIRRPVTRLSTHSSDQLTQKYLLDLADGQSIESVVMRFEGRRARPDETERFTACISTQAGCAMGCVFCATGQMGFSRHLTPGEIVGQIVFIEAYLRENGATLRNIVLMGMGEPLHNYKNTLAAIHILTDHKGLSIAPSRITLSTVGLPHGIRRLADEELPINLAVSLHGATDQERQALVPPARHWPLEVLIDACRYYIERRKRRIFFEWTLIEGKNDTEIQATALGQLLQGLDAHINVIPLNPTAKFGGSPSRPERVQHFQRVLRRYGLPSTVRQRRGIDIAAGCGQLRSLADR
ncbi:MAG: 23S rRNA (adenine(2503)-C(2))-methyltransferase RlmN [Chloroflexota bacterium]